MQPSSSTTKEMRVLHPFFFQMDHSLVTVSVLHLEGCGGGYYTKGTHTDK